jgi:hypothetical protein
VGRLRLECLSVLSPAASCRIVGAGLSGAMSQADNESQLLLQSPVAVAALECRGGVTRHASIMEHHTSTHCHSDASSSAQFTHPHKRVDHNLLYSPPCSGTKYYINTAAPMHTTAKFPYGNWCFYGTCTVLIHRWPITPVCSSDSVHYFYCMRWHGAHQVCEPSFSGKTYACRSRTSTLLVIEA